MYSHHTRITGIWANLPPLLTCPPPYISEIENFLVGKSPEVNLPPPLIYPENRLEGGGGKLAEIPVMVETKSRIFDVIAVFGESQNPSFGIPT